MIRERRIRIVFWLTVLSLTVGAFTAEALLREQVCTSSMMVTAETVISTAIECT